MWRHTVKSLLTRKLRLALTAVAIALGVAMATGTLVAATALSRALEAALSVPTNGADIVVRSHPHDATGAIAPIPAAVVERLAAVDGVARATGAIAGYAQLLGGDGDALGGADLENPPEGRSLDWSAERQLVAGRLPAGPTQVAVDRINAETEGFAVGDDVTIVDGAGRTRAFTLTGILDLPDRRDEPVAGFDLATAQAVLGRPPGQFDIVHVDVVDGANPADVADRLATATDVSLDAATTESLADAELDTRRGELAYFSGLLLVAAGVALVVGGLIIRNTLAILIAQRNRELALLRCLGASPGQVRRSVLAEAAAMSAVASVIGVLGGIGVARAVRAAFESVDIFEGVPRTPMTVAPWIVAVGVIGGVLATMSFALGPARRASRVMPLAAMRAATADADPPSTPAARARRVVLVAGALATLAAGVVTGSGILVAVSALLTLIALEAAGALLARPVARVVGVPLAAAAGLPARLARQNAMRNPRRTAATAIALSIGVGLTTFLAIWTESQKATDHRAFDDAFTADFRIDVPATDFTGPIAPHVADELVTRPELADVAAFRSPVDRSVTAAAPPALDALVGGDVVAGDIGQLGAGTVAVSADEAARVGAAVGSTVEVNVGDAAARLRVVAVFDSYLLSDGLIEYDVTSNRSSDLDYVLSPAELDRLGGPATIGWIYARTADGATTDEARDAIADALAGAPTVRVQDRDELRTQGDAGVDAGLVVFFGLFGLIVVIALFGLVNVLSLSIVERVREVGLLRAIGLDPADVRSMIRAESVILAAFGVIVGLGLGTVFVWAMLTTAAPGSDLDLDLTIPIGRLAVVAALAVGASLVAAVPPSIHASRVDVLRAVSDE
jgi:putative ABC transport system permease protein